MAVSRDNRQNVDYVELKKMRIIPKPSSRESSPSYSHLDNVASISDDDIDTPLPHREDGDSVLYTREEEIKVVGKLDRRLVVFVALLYMLSFLDRSSKSAKF